MCKRCNILKKIDKTVIVETKFIGAWMLIFSVLMQAVFLIIGKWDYTVLLGNLLSGVAGIISFFVLGLTIVKAVSSGDAEYAKKFMGASTAGRTFFLFIVALLGVLLPCFNTIATLIPILFPRLGLFIRSFMVKRMDKNSEAGNNGEVDRIE
jgi:hypothetical protein